MARLEAEAKALRAQLVTTEKDAARLAPRLRRRVLTLPVRLRLDDPAPLDVALDRLFPPEGRAD
jgi:tetraacyldisaccharide 4'-kinase